MKKLIFFCIVLMVMAMQVTYAQGVAINSDGSTPDNSAMLDISSHSVGSGLLIPRLQLGNVGITFNGGPAPHLFVTNLNTAFNAGSRFNSGIGFYRNIGTKAAPDWRRLLESSDSTLFWGTRGNDIVSGDFLGTINAQHLSIRTNGVERIQVQSPTPGVSEVVVRNVLNFRIPLGSTNIPSLRFEDNNLGMFGVSLSGGTKGVGMVVGTNAYIYFSAKGSLYTNGNFGIRLRSSPAVSEAEALPESSLLDVQGNIFTRGKIIYNELANASQKTFLNEIHWNGTITTGSDSPQLLTEGTALTIVVRRTATDAYFFRIATDVSRTFTCIDQDSKQVVSVNPLGPDLMTANRVPINFTNNIVGADGLRTIFIKESARPNVTYQVTLLVLDNNVTVMIKRFEN